jgi:hypothetical protein
MSDRFLDDRAIAAFLNVSTRTVRRYRAAGRLPTRSVGRARGCLHSELLRALGVNSEFEAPAERDDLSADTSDNQRDEPP